MLHYDPHHVSSSTLLILKRTNCITAASGIVTLCKKPYSMQVESGLQSFSKRPDRLWAPSTLLLNGYRSSFEEVKRPGSDVIH